VIEIRKMAVPNVGRTQQRAGECGSDETAGCRSEVGPRDRPEAGRRDGMALQMLLVIKLPAVRG